MRGFEPDSLSIYHPHAQSYSQKFSVHVVVKHATHMFPNRASLIRFLNVIKARSDWPDVSDVVDDSVYNTNQCFRVPCASKAPRFCGEPGREQWDLASKQNILLMVNPVTGEQEPPVLKPGCYGYMSVPQCQWLSCLVCTPHRTNDKVLSLTGKASLFMLLFLTSECLE